MPNTLLTGKLGIQQVIPPVQLLVSHSLILIDFLVSLGTRCRTIKRAEDFIWSKAHKMQKIKGLPPFVLSTTWKRQTAWLTGH